jgi:hypothetical protein
MTYNRIADERRPDMAGITWWTGERLAALGREIARGASYRAAAAALSRQYRRRITRAAVEGACRAQGLHGRARAGRPAMGRKRRRGP